MPVASRDRSRQRQPRPAAGEIDRLAARTRSAVVPRTARVDVLDQRLDQLHHVAVVGVRLVALEHRELGVVLARDALVAEVAADLVDAVEPADDQPLQVQLVRDAQVEILIVGCCGAW